MQTKTMKNKNVHIKLDMAELQKVQKAFEKDSEYSWLVMVDILSQNDIIITDCFGDVCYGCFLKEPFAFEYTEKIYTALLSGKTAVLRYLGKKENRELYEFVYYFENQKDNYSRIYIANLFKETIMLHQFHTDFTGFISNKEKIEFYVNNEEKEIDFSITKEEINDNIELFYKVDENFNAIDIYFLVDIYDKKHYRECLENNKDPFEIEPYETRKNVSISEVLEMYEELGEKFVMFVWDNLNRDLCIVETDEEAKKFLIKFINYYLNLLK